MDVLETYRGAVERVLTEYAQFLTTDTEIVWEDGYRIYGALLHIDILGGKLWIQQDGTEDGVAGELVAAGVPKRPNRAGVPRALSARPVGVCRRVRRV